MYLPMIQMVSLLQANHYSAHVALSLSLLTLASVQTVVKMCSNATSAGK